MDCQPSIDAYLGSPAHQHQRQDDLVEALTPHHVVISPYLILLDLARARKFSVIAAGPKRRWLDLLCESIDVQLWLKDPEIANWLSLSHLDVDLRFDPAIAMLSYARSKSIDIDQQIPPSWTSLPPEYRRLFSLTKLREMVLHSKISEALLVPGAIVVAVVPLDTCIYGAGLAREFGSRDGLKVSTVASLPKDSVIWKGPDWGRKSSDPGVLLKLDRARERMIADAVWLFDADYCVSLPMRACFLSLILL